MQTYQEQICGVATALLDCETKTATMSNIARMRQLLAKLERQVNGPTADPIDATREVNGRYAEASDPCAVTPVRCLNGEIGYRVGEKGTIYASYEVAKRHAARRREMMAAR